MVNTEVLDLSYDVGDRSDEESGIWCNDIDEIVDYIKEVKDTVKKIKLYGQDSLGYIPNILGECKLLEELDISGTPVKEIPDFVYTLPNLRFLKMYITPNENITKAVNLETLYFWVGKEDVFPASIVSLKKLKNLDIFFSGEIIIPENLGTLTQLNTLELHSFAKGNSFISQVLPDSFIGHRSLKEFIIHSSSRNEMVLDLDRLTSILSSCPAFEVFSLKSLYIKDGYQNLSRLGNLKELSMYHLRDKDNVNRNPFDVISSLVNLEILDIYGSEFKIKELPDIFGNLSKLREFCFGGNFVQNIPPSLYSLTNLIKLDFICTGITSIDENIGNMQNLEIININDNMLETLPESIFTLKNLKRLNISCNNFNNEKISDILEKLKIKLQTSADDTNPITISEIMLSSDYSDSESIVISNGKQEIEFWTRDQGRNIEEKNMRVMSAGTITDKNVYYKQCITAVNEDAHALGNVNKDIFGLTEYYKICEAAVKKGCYAIQYVDPKKANRFYFILCKQAAKGPRSENVIDYIHPEFLKANEYLQVCIEAVLNSSGYVRSLDKIKHDFLSREDYELVCRAAIVSNGGAVCEMIDPTPEICLYAIKRGARLNDIPENLRTREICLIAFETGNGESLNDSFFEEDVPAPFREELLKLHEEKKRKKEEELEKKRQEKNKYLANLPDVAYTNIQEIVKAAKNFEEAFAGYRKLKEEQTGDSNVPYEEVKKIRAEIEKQKKGVNTSIGYIVEDVAENNVHLNEDDEDIPF